MNLPSSPAHRLTWDLIPWLVNDTAAQSDRTLAEDHLATCIDCRDEYAFQSLLQAGLRADALREADTESSLRQLLDRIDATQIEDAAATGGKPTHSDESRRWSRRMRRGGARRIRRTVAALMLAQIAVLALLGVLLQQQGVGSADPNVYRTLGRSVGTDIATIRLVPAPELTLQALRALLDGAGVRIVDSNGDGSIYGLAPRDASRRGETMRGEQRQDTMRTIARLRAQPGVLLAEPIGVAAGAGH